MIRKKGEEGFVLLAVMLAASLLPVLVLIMSHFTDMSKQLSNFMKSSVTRQSLQAVKIQVVNAARDSDGDGHIEPRLGVVNVLAGTTVPLNFALGVDEWGTPLRYCTWDLGVANADPLYSQNNVAPPSAGLVARLVSAGKDRVFAADYATECQNGGSGDDVVVDVVETEILAGNGVLNGWSKPESGGVQLLNADDNVGIGTAPGADKLTISGNINSSGNVVSGGGVVASGDVLSGGKVSAGGMVSGTSLSTTGSLSAGSATVNGNVTATGTISANGGVQNPVYAP